MEIFAERIPAVCDSMELLPASQRERFMGESDGCADKTDEEKGRQKGKSKLRNNRFPKRQNSEFK